MGSGGGGVGGSSDSGGSSSGGGSSGGTSSSDGGASSSGGGSDSTSGSSSTGGGSDSGGSDRSDNDSQNGFDQTVADVGPSPAGPDPDDDDEDDDSRTSGNDDGDAPANGPTDPSADTGLTADQSRSLAESAAVMDGYAFSPPEEDEAEEDEGVVDRAVDAVVGTAAMAGGVVVGAAETVTNAAVETVSMVNDAAGTVLDAAVGWTGIDAFEGHAERNAARGQAMMDAVTSPIETAKGVANAVEEGWETFEDNWENERYFDAGRQIGGVGVEAAAVAVPASKVGALGKLDDVVPDTPSTRGSTPDLDGVRRDIEAAGAEVLTDADPDVRAYMDDAARRQGLEPDELQASTLGDTIMVRDNLKDDVVTLKEELEHVRQQQEGRVAVGADGYDTRVDLEIEARENMLESDDLTPAQRDQIQQEIDTIREQGRY